MEVTCELCGGKDFYVETGFYYCKECQTQSQEVREVVIDVQEGQVTRTKKIKQKKKTENLATSWECYNHILFGLVNELIAIGAKKELKRVVKLLWFKYLEKCEVISRNNDGLPKLNAVYSKMDAEIIYGKPAHKKRKRKRSESPSSTDSASVHSIRRKRGRDKKLFHQTQYDLHLDETLDSTATHSQSLASLKSSSDSSKKPHKIVYNRFARKEILKQTTKNHLKNHCKDFENELKCHRMTYQSLSRGYEQGVTMITRNKLYAIVYLSLLIVKDAIQLGDLLRYVREGHLSFDHVEHFFPEGLNTSGFNMNVYAGSSHLLTHNRLRETAATLAKFLEIPRKIRVQNLVELCERYCKELNLPREVFECCRRLMSQSPPRMMFGDRRKLIPNYEARAIGYVIFVLKLLFGLDDETEQELSKYARNVTAKAKQIGLKLPEMFVFDDWLKHIEYRKFVLRLYHFPTQFLYSKKIDDPNAYLAFLKEQNEKREADLTLTNEYQMLETILDKLQANESFQKHPINFPITLTPFYDYSKCLSGTPQIEDDLLPIIDLDFTKNSLDFVLKPYNYLKLLGENKRVVVKNHGRNLNFDFVPVENIPAQTAKITKLRNENVVVHIGNDLEEISDITREKEGEIERENETTDAASVLLNHKKGYKKMHLRNIKKVKKLSKNEPALSSDTSLETNDLNSSTDSQISRVIQYNPYEMYWLHSTHVDTLAFEDFKPFFNELPHAFRLILSECARILEQSEKCVFEEFNNIEIHWGYSVNFRRDERINVAYDLELQKLVRKVEQTLW